MSFKKPMTPLSRPPEAGPRPERPLSSAESWLDYVENEVDSIHREELTMLLLNSRPDRELVDELNKLRGLIKSSDEVMVPEDGAVYQRLHDGIMAAVANKKPKKTTKKPDKKQRRSLPRVPTKQIGIPVVFGLSFVALILSSFS